MINQAKITIINHDKTEESYITDPGSCYGITGIGYSVFFNNGRQLIIHPNSVNKIIIDELKGHNG